MSRTWLMLMYILVRNYRQAMPEVAADYSVVLIRDAWNDYGLNTLFHLRIGFPGGHWREAGETKILFLAQEAGPTPMPEGEFTALDPQYCSAGQSFDYYERLLDIIGIEDTKKLLQSLNDLVVEPERRRTFLNKRGLDQSLFRFDSAERAFLDAQELMLGRQVRTTIDGFTLRTTVGGDLFDLDIRFDPDGELPGRLHALIGYNGSGKTTALANLAMVASRDTTTEDRDSVVSTHGVFLDPQPHFGSVVIVSYSAFDTFAIPKEAELGRTDSQSLRSVYCGLRHAGDGESAHILKSSVEVDEELLSALAIVTSKDRRTLFQRVMRPLTEEPSFLHVGLGDWLDRRPEDWRHMVRELSSGHKIVLQIAVQLVAHLQPGSLLVMDEPESHLHPPLLAALIRSVNLALIERQSIGVVATHSPVVLQEVPRRFVTVIERAGTSTRLRTPTAETFGENVSILTKEVFNLDNSRSDYRRVLTRLSEHFSMEEILELFRYQMSTQALAYLVTLTNGEDH